VVALNQFGTDTEDEIEVVRRACAAIDTPFAVSDHFARGGEGAVELAATVIEHAEKPSAALKPLYSPDDPLKTKMEKVARYMYGAAEISYTRQAEKDLKSLRELGYDRLPLCVAKTPTSLTDDPTIVGRPEGFEITIRGFIVAAGAGFVVPLLGDILRMPGLSASPQAHRMDLVEGKIVGLK
jgi:formate--tetrahydrofolate ligase